MTSKLWKIREKTEINTKLNFHPLILQLLASRGISEEKAIESFFNPDYTSGIFDPFIFPDMEKAAGRIFEAKEKKEKVAIFGDYDADGVTSTALLFEMFGKIGLKGVETYIPDRQLEGYGMNIEAIKYLHSAGVKLIVTVDCGITNIEEVQFAKELGMDVIITDHHHVPKKLPEALAVINPHMESSGYPFSELAGVGVAFKLIQALQQKADPKNMDQLKWFLDLVAIGTIADCVPLVGENRVIVKYGLVVLSKTRRVGLLEMFKVGRILIDENNVPDTQKVAFQISPRINAAGRMDHASYSYNLMVEKNSVMARDMALEVESKNQERQKVTKEIVREIRIIAENSFKDKKLIFAANEHWQVGILGLIAGKIADEFSKPTIILQKQEEEYVGSLRSIPQVNIIEALEKCSDLLIRFGGHSQAAGVRVSFEKIDAFYERLDQIVEKELEGKDIVPEIEIDAEIRAEDINWDLVSEIKKLEPFGQGNGEPVFLMKDMIIEDLRIVGNGTKHLKLSLRAENNSPKIFDAIGFGFGDKFPDLKEGNKVDIVFNLQEDEWNGNKKIQLRLVDLKI
ncbi:MAG TPA: single-stranded-DNA-specific exonuclease RecJ [Candidatus Moranbacteria bacterium]|nr:single-stranded-DNA-specific exonuclease RecJ [Candidatus Moranbacteria bacterium]